MLKAKYPSLSRREFLTTTAYAGGAMLLGPAGLAAGDGVDPRVAQVMSKTIGVDMHNHVYPAGTEPHPQGGQPPRQQEQQHAPGLLLAEEIKQSGLTAVCASFVLDFAPFAKPGDARDLI
jgi:membrane dipeptidase